MSEISDSVLSAAVVLLFVMDPLGNIPLFLSLLREVEPGRRQKIILRELFVALGILLIFLFFGQGILEFLDLQQESVSIAGGLVLLIIGLRMIFPEHEENKGDRTPEEPFIVPLAVPLIAGPSTLATLILFVHRDPEQMLNWFMALMLAWGATAVIMLSAPLLYRLLRERGLAAVERLMGMILIMIAVQMLINGIQAVT